MQENPGQTRAAIPFVVVLQSHHHDGYVTRLVAPLLAAPQAEALHPPSHLPRFTIEGKAMILDVLQTQSVARTILGRTIASLADDDSPIRIVMAPDTVLPRAHG